MGRALFPLAIPTAGTGVQHDGFSSRLKRYALGLGCAALAIWVARFTGHFGQVAFYLPLLAGLAVSAWFAGVGPALLCQTCGLVFAFYETGWPAHPESIDKAGLYGLLLFVVIGKLTLFLTANVRWNRDLRRGEESLRLVAGATNDCLWEWDLRSGRVLRSGNLSGVFGCPESMIRNNVEWWRERLHPEDRDQVWASLQRALAGTGDLWEAEYRLRRQDGTYILISDRSKVCRNRAGRAERVIGGMSDITAHRRAEERIAYDALHDDLTGLPNRIWFRDALARRLSQNGLPPHPAGQSRAADGGTAAVLFLGLDRFKIVNDSLGHAAGDRVLRALSKRIELALHPGETAARFGGDEFTVLLENVSSLAEAEQAAGRVLQSLSYPYQFEGHSLSISASAGIALAEATMLPEEVLRFADIAMYRAKARGRGRCEVFESSIDAATMNVLQRESEIRRGLESGDFRVYYQPIVDLASGYLAGFEALLRWQHPTRGVLLPAEFLPLAEESGLITELGHWALRTACRHLRIWRSARPGESLPHLTVSVNLAGRQFAEPDLVLFLNDLLRENELEGPALILELTENMILENSLFATNRLEELRSLGVRIAIDDFGKGHSSFGRLQDLQVSIVKIDGSFVRRIEEGKPEIVDAVIALAKKLKLEVTAECVETERQFAHLQRSLCTSAQGLYFSPALNAAETAELLRTEPRWATASVAHAAT